MTIHKHQGEHGTVPPTGSSPPPPIIIVPISQQNQRWLSHWFGKETPKDKRHFPLFFELYIGKAHNRSILIWTIFDKKYMCVHQFILLVWFIMKALCVCYCTFCELLWRTGMHRTSQCRCAHLYHWWVQVSNEYAGISRKLFYLLKECSHLGGRNRFELKHELISIFPSSND